ncbi:MAG: hypothetical protein V2J14_09485, partial [Erythrobacter sp.]|nr:hypothetical protein [Erythrobacter sp.]
MSKSRLIEIVWGLCCIAYAGYAVVNGARLEDFLFGAMVLILVGLPLFVAEFFGRKFDIGEARFDSETGRQLPPY